MEILALTCMKYKNCHSQKKQGKPLNSNLKEPDTGTQVLSLAEVKAMEIQAENDQFWFEEQQELKC